MAIKLDYVARETATNLTRNITLTVASVLTVVVSLTLFGSAVLLNQGVNNANDRLKGGIESIIYLQPTSTQEQKDSIRRDLEANPDVKDDGITYVDQDETYDEFKRLFGDSPELVETVTPDILPPSFRIAPRVQDPDVVQALGDQFQAKPGVYEVVFAFEVVKRIQEPFNKIGVRSAILEPPGAFTCALEPGSQPVRIACADPVHTRPAALRHHRRDRL